MTARILTAVLLSTCLFAGGKRLSFDQAQGESPFNYASLNIINWLPNENSYMTKKGNSLLKVDIMKSDTT
ncbi:MAG: hypothetical protein GY912_03960, partial [Candidatus Marinimicrobia bacterium]|nr:hypothetical protein [Candidatus Neomarinimicrobiota bacterium]